MTDARGGRGIGGSGGGGSSDGGGGSDGSDGSLGGRGDDGARDGHGVPHADEVWGELLRLVTHNLEYYRRVVSDAVGLPFSRVRVIRRLVAGPLTMGRLAEASGMDAPAATVAVNDLEQRGLVERTTDPANRRVKIVALTAAGYEMFGRVDGVRPSAPAEFATLGVADLEALSGILGRVGSELADV